jgi:hypothetical protein
VNKKKFFQFYLTFFVVSSIAFVVTSYWTQGINQLGIAIAIVLLVSAFFGPVAFYAVLHKLSIPLPGGLEIGPKSADWERNLVLLLLGLAPGFFFFRSIASMWS